MTEFIAAFAGAVCGFAVGMFFKMDTVYVRGYRTGRDDEARYRGFPGSDFNQQRDGT